MKISTAKSSAPTPVVRLGDARRLTKASFTGLTAELVSPYRLYSIGG